MKHYFFDMEFDLEAPNPYKDDGRSFSQEGIDELTKAIQIGLLKHLVELHQAESFLAKKLTLSARVTLDGFKTEKK